MITVVKFLDARTEELVNYWLSTYYVRSEEYALRRHAEGFLEAERREAILIFKKALQCFEKNERIPYIDEIVEDRRDMQTPFHDAYINLETFFTAINEFLMIHYEKKTLNCSQNALFKILLEIRKIETISCLALVNGYHSNSFE